MDLSQYAPEASATPDTPRPVDRWPRWWWERAELSANTHRSFTHAMPRTRGWLHLTMAVAGWPVLVVVLVRATSSGRELAAALAFGLGMQAMFTASAVTHLRRWGVWTTELLFRVDHTGIFLAIAGSITPFALVVLDGWGSVAMLVGVWVVTLGGMAFALWPSRTPVGFGNTIFITIGALVLPFLPRAWGIIGPGGVLLLLAGGAMYIGGALMLAHQWPTLRPKVFGYHEVWHLLVTVATLLHWVMVREYYLAAA